MERVDPRQLNHVAAASAVWAFAIADLPAALPRNEAAPPAPPPAAAARAAPSAAVVGSAVGAAVAAAAAALFVFRARARGARGAESKYDSLAAAAGTTATFAGP